MKNLTNVQKKTLRKQGIDYVISEVAAAISTIVDSAEYLGNLIILGRQEWGSAFDQKLRELGVIRPIIISCVRVAKGVIDPRLVLCSEADIKYQYLSRCDLSVQKQVLDKGVKVLVIDSEGKSDHIMVSIDNLQDGQFAQCFHSGGLRDIAEQRAWIESRRCDFQLNPARNPRKQSWETDNEYSRRLAKVAQAKLDEAEKAASAPAPAPAPKPTPKDDYEITDEFKLRVNKEGYEFEDYELLELVAKIAKLKAEVDKTRSEVA